MNCLEKYRGKLIREINGNLRIILDTPAEIAVHDFRVGIKRLTALYRFLDQIEPGLLCRRQLKPYRSLSKSIGNIRDAHVAINLIQTLDHGAGDACKPLVKKLEAKIGRDYRLFRECARADARIPIRMPTIKALGLSERAILRHKPVMLETLLLQILHIDMAMNATKWHKKRILLKRYHHSLDAFCFCPGHRLDEAELKRIKMLEQLLGDWHDRVVTAELLHDLTGDSARTVALLKKQHKLLLATAQIYLRNWVFGQSKLTRSKY